MTQAGGLARGVRIAYIIIIFVYIVVVRGQYAAGRPPRTYEFSFSEGQKTENGVRPERNLLAHIIIITCPSQPKCACPSECLLLYIYIILYSAAG